MRKSTEINIVPVICILLALVELIIYYFQSLRTKILAR